MYTYIWNQIIIFYIKCFPFSRSSYINLQYQLVMKRYNETITHTSCPAWGGAGVFVAGKLFISTGLAARWQFHILLHFITCLYRAVLEVNYLFHAESAQNYLKKKLQPPPPLLEIEWWLPKLTSRSGGATCAFHTRLYSFKMLLIRYVTSIHCWWSSYHYYCMSLLLHVIIIIITWAYCHISRRLLSENIFLIGR